MRGRTLDSSDALRTARPLKYAQWTTFHEPLDLDLHGQLSRVTVCYEVYGRLNAARDNAVLICHALSGDSHVAAHDAADDPGWWDASRMVGPGLPIDTERYFVVCPNLLGGCRGTTGPGSLNPDTDRPYGSEFPTITIGDIVEVQKRLIDHLGIDTLLAAIGGSMGGHQVLHWATRFPDRVQGAIALATSPRLMSQALAFDVVGRNAILRDPGYRSGQYENGRSGPVDGLAIARMLAHITYLSREAMGEKFGDRRLQAWDVPIDFEKRFSVGAYLAHQGAKFVDRFDANSYIALTRAMDLFDLGGTPAELAASLAKSRCRWMVVSFSSDWLFPPDQSQDIVNALIASGKPVSYCDVRTPCGHDAFLLPQDADRYGGLVAGFLRRLGPAAPQTAEPDGDTEASRNPTSIFHPRRLDHDRILDLIPVPASVLDLGCGRGTLLTLLRQRGHDRIMGVELDEAAIVACVHRGLDVIQANLNRGLRQFGDRQLDFVVLSQTLQTVLDVERVLEDMLRVGRQCIVSFPNFGYHRLRRMLAEDGRAPEAPGVLRFKWYNSPNIRFLTIADFRDFCQEKDIRVHRCVALDTETGSDVQESNDPNLNADLAIFVISRQEAEADVSVPGRSPNSPTRSGTSLSTSS